MATATDEQQAEARRQRARIAALAKASLYDGREATAAARRRSPASVSYWMERVEGKEDLSHAEIIRRAEALRRLYYARLAYRRWHGGNADKSR